MKDKYKLHNKYFKSKHQIKPWLQEYLAKYNTKIVIERSDNHKIIFKCKNGREKAISKGKTRRQITCPFKIRANYSHKQEVWTLVVINDVHDHGIEEDSDHYDPVHEITQIQRQMNQLSDINDSQLSSQLSDNQLSDNQLSDNHLNQLPDNQLGHQLGQQLGQQIPDNPLSHLEPSLYDEDIIHNTVSKFDRFMKNHLNQLNDPIKLDILKRLVDNLTRTYKTLDDRWYLNNLGNLNDSGNYASIPLSPLLNDDSSNQLDITLPGINYTPKKNGFVFPNQLINPQLPPLNIHNPVSPSLPNLPNTVNHNFDKKLFTSINLLLDKNYDKFDKD